MNIRKLFFAPHVIALLAASAALTFPCTSQAVSIGEITLQSRLGEPLRAQVSLTADSGERIDDSCLSLLAPDPNGDGTGYLTRADLSLKTEGTHQYVTIVSRKSFNDAFAKLRLQVKCPGMGSIVKTLTVLPDLSTPAPQAPIAAPSVPASAPATSAPLPETRDVATNRHDTPQPGTKIHGPAKAARHLNKRRHLSAQASARKHERPEYFRLKLSGDPIDESRIGKISPEERASLLAQRKLLDADDQMANFLALQHQVKQLQDELGEIKLQLAQLGAPATASSTLSAATASAVQPSPATGAAVTQEKHTQPTLTAKPPTVAQSNPVLQNGLFAALGLLAVLALWQGLRHYNKIKSRIEIKPQADAEPILKPAAASVAASSATTSPSRPLENLESSIPAPSKASAALNEATLHPVAQQKIEVEVTEEDSMLEEAGLYTAHGHPAKAIEILKEIIKRRPSKADAWTLLLSIYSSLGNTAEFEHTAREFLKHHKDNPSWTAIKALGRTLDHNNPLYADNYGRIPFSSLLPDSPGTRRPIGEILMEMGALSKQDMQNCLDGYDPKKHGRFGGYLVARRAITLAQLDQALLQQQGINTETNAGSLPSLQDMENFLADFDPKRDGSVGEFLAARKVATPEQLSQLLHPQSSQENAAEPSPLNIPPSLGRGHTLDFVLDSTPGQVLDLEFESTAEKDKPLDFEVEPPAPVANTSPAAQDEGLAFPEIQLNFGNNELPGERTDKQ